jgi:hypothetical protein
MIIWGGYDGATESTRAESISRDRHVGRRDVDWGALGETAPRRRLTGTEMIIWGGQMALPQLD